MDLIMHFDGSCWPNPGGVAKYGFTIQSRAPDGSLILDKAMNGLVGEGKQMSNNYAELAAVAEGFEQLAELIAMGLSGIESILVRGDSQLAIGLMSGAYNPNPEKLYYPAWERAVGAQGVLEYKGIMITFEWIRREFNEQADMLSKLAVVTASPELLEEAEELLLDNPSSSVVR